MLIKRANPQPRNDPRSVKDASIHHPQRALTGNYAIGCAAKIVRRFVDLVRLWVESADWMGFYHGHSVRPHMDVDDSIPKDSIEKQLSEDS